MTVQSSLGEALRAEIEVTSLTPDEASSLRSAIASGEAFRAAGVDFNPVLVGAQATLQRRADGKPVIRLTGERSVSEPFIDVILDFSWSGGRLQRSYTLLIDPPARPASPATAQAPAPTTSPVFSAPPPPPVTQAPRPPVSAPAAPPTAPAPALKPAATGKPAPAPAPAPDQAAASDSVKVRSGDTLSSIASANLRRGVSLDQMLVGLYRGNPQAFLDNNMNRLKAGVVLSLPDAQTADAISQPEAREVIQAHSADFAAFRQRLAEGAPAVKSNEPARQTSGKVAAAVQDRATASKAPAADQLTLSRSPAKAGAAPEAKISKDTERKAAETRVAELARNVQELKAISAGSGTAAKPADSGPSKPGLNVPVTAPAVPAKAAASTPSPTPPTKVPAPAPVTAASVPAAKLPVPAAVVPSAPPARPVVASAAAPVVPPASSASSSTPAPSTPVAASAAASAAASSAQPAASAASAVKRKAPAPAPIPEESLLDAITSNPIVLAAGAALVALLAGLGVMRLRRRNQEGAAETSFVESKLQADSFFGASGGHRVDTRDGSSGNSSSSSLSYSLSQLDAIGDVDPVAEADVYLAYGRDLQAEEILKEALRSDPGRVAVRSKMLEVYAKRADTRNFETQARQLLEMTGGVGDEWAKAQDLGREIDPGNPLYRPDGPIQEVDIDTSSDPTGDLAEPPAPNSFDRIEPSLDLPDVPREARPSTYDLDIDLESTSSLTGLENTRPLTSSDVIGDLKSGPDSSGPSSTSTVQAAFVLQDDEPLEIIQTGMEPLPDLGDFDDLPAVPASAPTAPAEFDFGDLSLELNPPSAEPSPPKTIRGELDDKVGGDTQPSMSFDLDQDDADPLQRKIELADEFRRIGDVEGARDLLEEVLAKSSGTLRTRAQAMLDELG